MFFVAGFFLDGAEDNDRVRLDDPLYLPDLLDALLHES